MRGRVRVRDMCLGVALGVAAAAMAEPASGAAPAVPDRGAPKRGASVAPAPDVRTPPRVYAGFL